MLGAPRHAALLRCPRSFDFGNASAASSFVSWVFTRSRAHCERLVETQAVDGCSVVDDEEVGRNDYLTYCERVYLNPTTGLGPDWDNLLPARLYHVRVDGERDSDVRTAHRTKAYT